jgi:hypothetical protein
VVGWYLPGFADVDRDIRASAAVLTYATPDGQRFDGFAPDIEDRSAIEQAGRRTATVSVPPSRSCRRSCTATVVTDLPASEVLARFDAGVAEYSRRLRRLVGGATLGAIVPDARNDQRAPDSWTGFPWPEIAARYDAVLPMTYWSVVKPAGCPAQDAGPTSGRRSAPCGR